MSLFEYIALLIHDKCTLITYWKTVSLAASINPSSVAFSIFPDLRFALLLPPHRTQGSVFLCTAVTADFQEPAKNAVIIESVTGPS